MRRDERQMSRFPFTVLAVIATLFTLATSAASAWADTDPSITIPLRPFGPNDELVLPDPPGSNYAQCLLAELPGTSNPAVRAAVVRKCYASYPRGLANVQRGAGLQMWFAPSSPDECILKKAKGTTDAGAAGLITAACFCLYSAPDFAGQLCGR